jgi:hypothetical protein
VSLINRPGSCLDLPSPRALGMTDAIFAARDTNRQVAVLQDIIGVGDDEDLVELGVGKSLKLLGD